MITKNNINDKGDNIMENTINYRKSATPLTHNCTTCSFFCKIDEKDDHMNNLDIDHGVYCTEGYSNDTPYADELDGESCHKYICDQYEEGEYQKS